MPSRWGAIHRVCFIYVIQPTEQHCVDVRSLAWMRRVHFRIFAVIPTVLRWVHTCNVAGLFDALSAFGRLFKGLIRLRPEQVVTCNVTRHHRPPFYSLKRNVYKGRFTYSIPCPCRALIHTCHDAPLPCSNSAVSFVNVRMLAGNIRLLVQQCKRSSFL